MKQGRRREVIWPVVFAMFWVARALVAYTTEAQLRPWTTVTYILVGLFSAGILVAMYLRMLSPVLGSLVLGIFAFGAVAQDTGIKLLIAGQAVLGVVYAVVGVRHLNKQEAREGES